MKSYNFSDIDNLSSFNSFSSLKDFNLPEFCFAGRSNVGKSSMINSLLNRKKAATTSNKPGHTKKIFLYKVSNSFILVDLPGYGFANTSKKKTREISELLFLYLTKRSCLKKIFVLIDSRIGVKSSDKSFIDLLNKNGLEYKFIFTKFDKINSEKKKILLSDINSELGKIGDDVIFTSSKTKFGIKKIRREILHTFNK